MADINKITREDVKLFADKASLRNLMDLYQEIATKTAIYPGAGSPLGLMYVGLKGAGEAGEFAEHVGKAMRDNNFGMGMEYNEFGQTSGDYVNLTSERKAALIKEVGDQLWYLSAKCNELGITLSEAALKNLEKLCDRTERGKLSGSGDNR
jgi:NTP pyrophosphatase (non-canonical NTP hydrolase)